MKARPILMSGPMVRALLDGRKTQTRRVIKPQPAYGCFYAINESQNAALHMARGESGYAIYVPPKPNSKDHRLTCPYGEPGDLLWVRETWIHGYEFDANDMPIYDGKEMREKTWYRATTPEIRWADHDNTPWKPSIHMPRWASRVTLELTGVRVERKQDISEADAIAEGVEPILTGAGEQCGWRNYLQAGEGVAYCIDPRDSYATLTDSINGLGSFHANAWVWVLEFKVHQVNVDALPSARAA